MGILIIAIFILQLYFIIRFSLFHDVVVGWPHQQHQATAAGKPIEGDVEKKERESEPSENGAKEEKNSDDDDDDDDEPIYKLLEPFSHDQRFTILLKTAETNPDFAARIRRMADTNLGHRDVFVRGLDWYTTDETLHSAFSQYGEIERCKVVIDKETGKCKGYGFVTFKSRSGARKALEQPKKMIGGRISICNLAGLGKMANSTTSNEGNGPHHHHKQVSAEYSTTHRLMYVSVACTFTDAVSNNSRRPETPG